jgi:hypothetical protein
MDANSGLPWSETDISLTHEIARGSTMETANFLCRDEDEARQNATQLALLKHDAPQPVRFGTTIPFQRFDLHRNSRGDEERMALS